MRKNIWKSHTNLATTTTITITTTLRISRIHNSCKIVAPLLKAIAPKLGIELLSFAPPPPPRSPLPPPYDARTSEKYAAPYTTSTLICLMASVQCGIIGLCANHNISAWSLTPGIRAFSRNCVHCSSILPNVMVHPEKRSSICLSVQSLATRYRGDSQLGPSRREIICWNVRSGLIVMALYAVLWGKNKEMNAKNNVEEDREEEKQEVVKSDLEMQFSGLSNGNHNLHTIKS
ncbi:hypothetical protein HYC85_013780 [Camellia sinensis]|uniref:Uncharacterized protein n=1 Tax=Camellia sinensis TaxID=4442 RepID=A0A7J7H4A5_CAMSI|nr:hypothetical protein HYC85_013780 [Camellia sinensis]